MISLILCEEAGALKFQPQFNSNEYQFTQGYERWEHYLLKICPISCFFKMFILFTYLVSEANDNVHCAL